MDLSTRAQRGVDVLADRLADPDAVHRLRLKQGWWPQSLAHGAVGVALLHIERARAEQGPWQRVHDWLACAAAQPAVGGPDSHLYYGTPALAFALNAAADRPGRYARARETLDQQVTTQIRRRLDAAHARIDAGALPPLAEFDTIRGLSGMGALLLHRSEHTELLQQVLSYLVRLTEPVKTEDAEPLPGWWSHLAPSGKPSPAYPEGHANHGLAHGIAGPLALLSLTARHHITVPGQTEAIRRILDWLDRWQQNGPTGPWWPYWITRAQLRSHRPGPGPSRPSWCYGTAGLARAQQLAALALNDTTRQHQAEQALLHALGDAEQLDATVDVSLCHGFAGLTHITRLVAADARAPGLAERLPRLLAPITTPDPHELADTLLHGSDGGDIGLLEGAAGTALALHAVQSGAPSLSGWDSCFLIT